MRKMNPANISKNQTRVFVLVRLQLGQLSNTDDDSILILRVYEPIYRNAAQRTRGQSIKTDGSRKGTRFGCLRVVLDRARSNFISYYW